MTRKKKQDERGSSSDTTSLVHKVARAETKNMANASDSTEVDDEEEQPTMKDLHKLLISIQEAISKVQIDNSKMSKDISELKVSLERSDQEIKKVKEIMEADCRTITSLNNKLAKCKKTVKEQKEELEDLKIDLDELEQYSRKNSVEIHGIHESVNSSTEEITIKVARTIGVELVE